MDVPRAAAAFILMYNIIERNKRTSFHSDRTILKRKVVTTPVKEKTFDVIEDTVKNLIRMSLDDFNFLISLIKPKVQKMDTTFRQAIPVRVRLAVTLRFLATGDSYTSLQFHFRVSKQTISKFVPEVCDAIIDVLGDYVKIPSSEEEWLTVSQEFENKWNFPHAIGAVDGIRVMLQTPMNIAQNKNSKDLFNIVLLALVDADYNFLCIDIRYQEKTEDAFKNTQLYKKLEEKSLRIPPPSIIQVPYSIELPYYILGNKTFTLNDYCMKLFEGTQVRGSDESVFNYRLSRARTVVENAFGTLTSTFKVLRKPIILEPDRAIKIISATVHLHNFLRRDTSSRMLYTPEGYFDTDVNGEIIPGQWRNNNEASSHRPLRDVGRRSGRNKREKRLHLARHFVTNMKIPSQNNY